MLINIIANIIAFLFIFALVYIYIDILDQDSLARLKQQELLSHTMNGRYTQSFCDDSRCILDHGEGDCVATGLVVKKKYDLTDDFALRYRHKEIFALSNDDEVLYLFASPNIQLNTPFGYGFTGAQVLARTDRIYFREFFLENWEKDEYVKSTLDIFLVLKRNFVFNLAGQVIHKFIIFYLVHSYGNVGLPRDSRFFNNSYYFIRL